MVILQPVFRVRVVYKSGYTHDFECTKFTVIGGSRYEWIHADDANKPVQISADDIAAVWQIGYRHRIRLKFWEKS